MKPYTSKLSPKIVPPTPINLPRESTLMSWSPTGDGTRIQMVLVPHPQGYTLSWFMKVRRAYADGTPVNGSIANTCLSAVVALNTTMGCWMIDLAGEDDAPKRKFGKGGFAQALAAIEPEILPYAKGMKPIILNGKVVVPISLHAPSGGLISYLNKYDLYADDE